MKSMTYDLGSHYTEQDLVEGLTEVYMLANDQPITERLIFYDTFDWRIYKKSLILY